MKLAGYGLALAALLGVAPAAAQQKPAGGPFDGRYVGSMKCTGPTNTRWGGLTIRQSRFTHIFKTARGAGTLSCDLDVKPDGSFANPGCDLPTTGKVGDDKLEIHFKAPEAIRDVTAAREKS